MQAHDLADLAALLAVHGEQIAAADPTTFDHAMADYWKASRCRLDRWYRSLAQAARQRDRVEWSAAEIGLVEEILVGEILARVLAAVATAHDQRRGAAESAPIARNILTAHVDAKRRAIALVVAPHRDPLQADEVLALRRQCARWTDLLLAYVTPADAASEFALDPARLGDFAYDTREHLRGGAASDMAVAMIVAGMRSSVARLSTTPSPNADLHRDIATALVSGLDADLFDAHGHLISPWLTRLRNVPREAPTDDEAHWSPHAAHPTPRPSHRRW